MINRLAVCVSDCLMLCIVEAVLDSLTLFLFSTRTALFPFFFFLSPPLFCYFECLYMQQYLSVYHRLSIELSVW